MSNFKSGSGNLDFGGDGDDEADESGSGGADTRTEAGDESGAAPTDASAAEPADDESSPTERTPEPPASDEASAEDAAASGSPADEYPYFVRRSNVGDERDTRLEIHVRDKVANREARFRHDLAEQLGADEIAKTDAREFALLAAFRHPERVAELMREEGFGALD